MNKYSLNDFDFSGKRVKYKGKESYMMAYDCSFRMKMQLLFLV